MTVKLQSTTYRYIGLSTDKKPLPAGEGEGSSEPKQTDLSLPPGSSFMESDTGRIYRWTGESWKFAEPTDESAVVLTVMYLELVEIRRILQVVVGG